MGKPLQSRNVLQHMEVPSRRGVFLLGCFERRITLYSQQVRALNLVHALFERKRLKKGTRMVVVGAGAGGLTVAAGAALRGCKVTVLEQRADLLPLLAGNRTRWLHPHIYEWPLPGSENENAGLPVLDWKAGTVKSVVEQLRAGWKLLASKHGITVRFGAEDIQPEFQNEALAQVAWNDHDGYHPEAADVLVLAVGFGIERQQAAPGFHSYWENDDLDQPVSHAIGRETRILISGTGDGGLVDLFRAVLRDFEHAGIVREFLTQACPQEVKEELLAIEDELRDGRVLAHALSTRYNKLPVPAELDAALRERLRPNVKARLNGQSKDPLSPNASVLNRFLASRLLHLGVQYRRGGISEPLRTGNEYEVTFDSGRTERFDRVVLRHGPRPALERDFPWLSKEDLGSLRARSELDQTREPIWSEGDFDAEVEPGMKRPLPQPAPKPPSLPQREPSPFIGRGPLLEKLVGALGTSERKAVVVTGTAGIGKTRLVLEALHHDQLLERFGNRRYFVSCRAGTADTLLGAIAEAIGVAPGPDLKERVRSELEADSAVLVLDDAEQVAKVDASGTELLLDKLSGIEGLTLVMCTRGQGHAPLLRAGRTFSVPPLDEAAARELFHALTPRADVNEPVISQLLASMKGQPLGIQLLARVTPLQEQNTDPRWEQWRQQRKERLASSQSQAPEQRAGMLLDVFLRSPLLTESGRRLLALLALLPDGISAQDVEQLLPGTGLASATTLEGLGLARVDEASRWHIPSDLRELAHDVLPPLPEDRARAITHYGALADALGPQVGDVDGARALHRLRGEVNNLEEMLLGGLEFAEPRTALDQTLALNNFWRLSGYGSTRVLVRAREVAHALGEVLHEALCLQVQGQFELRRSAHARAEALFREALSLLEQVGPSGTASRARCIRGLASIALDGCRLDEAWTCFEQSLRLFREIGSVRSQGNSIHGLGKVALARGDLRAARAFFEEALSLFSEVGDEPLGRAHCLRSLGELDKKPALLEQAHELFAKAGDLRGKAHCLRSLGDLSFERGELDDAQALYTQARPLLKQVGSLRGEANCLLGLGQVARDRAQPETARAHLEEAVQLFARVDDARSVALCRKQLHQLASRK